MKRILFAFILLILSFSLFAYVEQNGQKIFEVGCEEYEAITYIYISQGRALPSTAGPWSAEELKLMLAQVDHSKLSGYSLELYEWVENRLSTKSIRFPVSPIFAFSISGDVGLRAGYHTNAKDFNNPDDVYTEGTGDWNKQLPLLAVPLETYFGTNIYGFSSFDLMANRSLNAQGGDISNPKGFSYMTNIMFIPPADFSDLSANFPYRALGAIGGKWWSFEIGKDNLSWGAGESGNLLLGDHLPYHNQIRFTAFSEKFKYTFVTSSFPHPSNYIEPGTPDSLKLFYNKQDKKDGLKAFIGHRLEWTIADKLGMAISESIIYQTENNMINLQFLSPTAIFHSFFMRSNANSALAFEVDWTVIDCLNIYGQILIDEFKLPGEPKLDSPTALGYLLGVKTSIPLQNGILYGSLEGVYTDPYLYLRDDGNYSPNAYGINYIVAIPEHANISGQYDLNYLGYRYGNDAIVANLNAGYKSFGKWFAEGTIRYMAHGCFDMNTISGDKIEGGSKDDPSAPTTSHPDSGSYLPGSNWSSRNAVSHTITISLKGGITPINNLNISAELTFINIHNFKNILGNMTSDLQTEVSVTYSF